jgi:ribosomal protein L25 (general stress protein Ctc)
MGGLLNIKDAETAAAVSGKSSSDRSRYYYNYEPAYIYGNGTDVSPFIIDTPQSCRH